NGVDVEHFHSNNYKPGPLIRNDNRPLIGYHGAVASWFDAGLVAKVAELRPDYDFVIIGPVSDPKAEAELRSCSNIRLLGAMPYEDLPAYVAQFDASIMPFVLSKLTHAVRPLKILEYLSMGKPVVSTPIHEILDWPGVSFGETAESFAEKLDLALKNGLEDKETVEAFVMESAWERVIQPLLKALDAKETQVKLKQ
ncbi:MAG: glycosyltransferase, partial [Syntrophothermus sp.]